MTSQQFLLISFIFAVILGAWYWASSRRNQNRPSMLDMSKPTTLKTEVPELGVKLQEQLKKHPRKYGQADFSSPQKVTKDFSQEKNLNVLFNYNGHTWDAYEVLGIPAGAPLHLVTQAYQREISKQDPTSHPFLQAAYQAILSQY